MYCILLLAGIDYDATPLTATFNTGETSVTVTIPVVDDRVVNEVDEEFNLSLSISSTTGVRVELGDVSSARGIIIDTSKEVNHCETVAYYVLYSKTTNHHSSTQ